MKPASYEKRPVLPNCGLFQRLAFVGLAALAVALVVDLDFLANSRVLLLKDRLAPKLTAIMKMHLARMARHNRTRTARGSGDQQEQGHYQPNIEET